MTRDPEFNEGRLFALIRHGETVQVDMQTKMTAGDIAWYVLPENKGNAFAEQFSARSDTAFVSEFCTGTIVGLGLGAAAGVYAADQASVGGEVLP